MAQLLIAWFFFSSLGFLNGLQNVVQVRGTSILNEGFINPLLLFS
jgi:hypothetical protein